MARRRTTAPPARRKRGEGTIYQTRDGQWCAQVDLGRDETTGKRRRKQIRGATQDEVVQQI